MLKMLTYRITTKFGEIDSFHSTPHTGIDFACPVGTQAQSISDGIISKISNDPMLGENIRVNAAGGREFVYGHLSQVNVTYGQHVNSGDVLGLTGGIPGTPGAGHSTGPHVHISMLQNGSAVDPAQMISSATSASQQGWLGKLWHVISTPGVDLAKEEVGNRLIDMIDPTFTIATIVLILLAMMGSTKAKKGVFWSISLYILIKLIATSL